MVGPRVVAGHRVEVMGERREGHGGRSGCPTSMSTGWALAAAALQHAHREPALRGASASRSGAAVARAC